MSYCLNRDGAFNIMLDKIFADYRDAPPNIPQVLELKRALESGDEIFVTGIVLQELLQGFNKPKARDRIIEYFKALPLLIPEREDHVKAAELRNQCRKKGVQAGIIDALLAQLCIHYELQMLTTDKDFTQISNVVHFPIWS